MPGVGTIGIASRYTSATGIAANGTAATTATATATTITSSQLPAQVRTLNRTLSLLPSSHDAANVLRDSLESLASSAMCEGRKERGLQQQLVHDMQTRLAAATAGVDDQQTTTTRGRTGFEILQIVTALDQTFQSAFSETKKLQQHQQSPVDSSSKGRKIKGARRKHQQQAREEMPPPPPRHTDSSNAAMTTKQATRTALISDSEDGLLSATEESTTEIATTENQLDKELVKMDFWSNLLEAVHLQVSSRTTTIWGKKKIYQVYQLAGPAMPVVSAAALEDVRRAVQKEFLAVYDGSIDDDVRAVRYSECRVYATIRTEPVTAIWIQINVGRSLDLTDEVNRAVSGEKKKKNGTEFVAVVTPESPLIVLTASRAASRSPFTPYIVSALEATLTCSVVGGYASQDDDSQRFGELFGTEPYELFKQARDLEARNAMGRFASYAAAEQAQNPITALQSAATSSLLCRRTDKARLQVGAQHGRQVANLSALVKTASNGQATLVAVNKAGTIVDHSAALAESRKRDRDDAFGRAQDCPVRTHVRWDWKGQTSAAAAAWLDTWSDTQALPQHTFKCRVVLQGSNVFAGMRALVEAGLLQAPLPDYVKDAPTMGGTIRVHYGAIDSTDDNNNGKK